MTRDLTIGRGNHLLFTALCAGAALLAAGTLALMLQHGIKLTPDSWSYWEGSVSLLHGRGYYEFSGRRVWSWPPGYSYYLAAWQAEMGVSGKTLARANIALASAAALAWTAVFVAPYRRFAVQRRRGTWVLPVVAALYVAMTVALGFRAAMAHNLAYTLFPIVLLLTSAMVNSDRTAGSFFLTALANLFVMSLLTATHYSFVFLPLTVAATIVLLARQPMRLRLMAAALLTAAPGAVWWAVRWKLGTLASHKVGSRPRFGWTAYAGQLLGGVGSLFAPDKHQIGKIFFAATCVLLILGFIRTRRHVDGPRRAMLAHVVVSSLFLFCLYVVFNRTYIIETLYSDRFLLFFPLTIFPAAVMLIWQSSNGGEGLDSSDRGGLRLWSRCAAVAVLVAVSIISVVNAGYAVRNARATAGPLTLDRARKDQGFAYNQMTIDCDYPKGPPKAIGRMILVSPGRDFEKHAARSSALPGTSQSDKNRSASQ